MDIWAWVHDLQQELYEAGELRLCELIDVMPHYTVEHRHDEVEALIGEALAAARAKKSPWLEVYFRHWLLQSRVLKRCEVKRSLPEAVDLLDFANREETKQCPQSVCVVQDLANCYGKADGPGYAAERIEVAEETLARIDPKWPCYMCISSELASAILDDGRPDEALQLARKAEAEVGATEGSQMRGAIVSSLLQLGRPDEALQTNERASVPEAGRAFELSKEIDHARILAKLGRYEEAKAALPKSSEIHGIRDDYDRYTDTITELAIAGTIENSWRLGMLFRHLHEDLESSGAMRTAFVVAQRRAHLALARRAYATVADTLEDLRRIAPELHRPLDAPDRIRIIEELLTERKKGAPSVDPDTLAQRLQELGEDPEQDLEVLHAVAAMEPLDAERAKALGDALFTLGQPRRAIAAYEDAMAASPNEESVVVALADMYGREEDFEAFDALLARVQGAALRALVLALRAQFAARTDDFTGARRYLEEALSLSDDVRIDDAGAWVERRAGDWDAALAHLERMVAKGETDADTQWDRALAATMVERWDLVRTAAIALEHPVEPGDTPIDARWGTCRVVFEEPDGRTTATFALRTGPVTARVLELASPGEPQHKGDEVVFDPQPVAQPAEGEEGPVDFAVVATKTVGGFTSYHLDGARPDDDALEAFAEALDAEGGAMWIKSGDEYAIAREDDEAPTPAWYVVVGFPAEVSAEAAARWLAQAGLPEPTVWPELTEAVGDEAEIERQRAVAVEWGL